MSDMVPTWLIESDVFPNECEQLVKELVRQGVPHVVCKFGKSYEEYIADFDNDACLVFHGSLQFGSLIRRKTNWTGLYCDLPKFECLYYYPRLGGELLNDNCIMLPFGNLDRRKDSLFDLVGKDGQMFIRPSSGYKTFTGKVASIDTWEKDFKLFSFYGIDPEALIIVSSPVKIKREWRAVVADNRVIAGCEYQTDEDWKKTLPLPMEIHQYAQGVLDSIDYRPDPVWTIDICEDSNGNLKVVEVGSFSCAGLYSCDCEPIVTTINQITMREWKDQNDRH